MSSANKKHMQGGMNTTYSNVNTEDERNKKAEELLFQAWETAGYYGQPDEDYYPRTAQETRDMEDLLTQAEAAIDDPSDTELMEVMADTRSAGMVQTAALDIRMVDHHLCSHYGMLLFLSGRKRTGLCSKETGAD